MLFMFRRLFMNSNNFILGRWFINYDNKIISLKIDQANEDHCGCCKNNKDNSEKDDYDDDYYKPFL